MGVNDTADFWTSFIQLAMNGKFVRHLIVFSQIRPVTVKIYPSYSVDLRITYTLFLRTPAAYEHFIRIGDANTHVA
jgi:hypothetical protein